MKIGIGEWKMRNGGKAVVLGLLPGSHNYPLIGYSLDETGDGEVVTWSLSGNQFIGDQTSRDLISTWTSPIAPGHNPDKLTEEQVGVKDGWRLLEWEEIKSISVESKKKGLEFWGIMSLTWKRPDGGPANNDSTYRTRLSREELAALDKPKKRLIRVEELPPICLVRNGTLVSLVTSRDSATQYIKVDSDSVSHHISFYKDAESGWSSDLKNWNSFEVKEVK